MPTVADYRRVISNRGTSKYYCVCGAYKFTAVEEAKHCSEVSKFDDMEVLNVTLASGVFALTDAKGVYYLWVHL